VHVIARKLVVPEVRPAVARGRLQRVLEESVERGTSTLVTGRRGTGKSTMAAAFCRATRRDVAWFDVDSADEDPYVFFSYLLAAIRRRRPNFGGGLTALDRVAEGDDMQSVANLFVYELLERPGPPLLVVLDNLHRVYDAAWSTPFFVRLLPLLPHDTHLLMIGRGIPPAPLWRLRSKQALYVVEESTLAFTRTEVRELLAHYGRTAIDPAHLLERTHGRAALVDAVARGDAESALPTGPPPRLQVSR
jgi:LuxR family maltose regulon positive regulatory protein